MARGTRHIDASVNKPITVRRLRLRRWLLRGLHEISSVRTANVLLAGIGAGGVVGILVAQFGTSTLASPDLYAVAVQRANERYGSILGPLFDRFGFYHVFTTGWFSLLVLAFAIAATANTLIREPRVLRDIRNASTRRGRAYFRSGLPGRSGPIEGLDGYPLPSLLSAAHYRVRTEEAAAFTHRFAEKNPFPPWARLCRTARCRSSSSRWAS